MANNEKRKEGAYAQLTGYKRAIPIILLALAIFIALCYFTKDNTGAFGMAICGFLLGSFSIGGYFIPVLFALHALFFPSDVQKKRVVSRIVFSVIILIFISAMAHAISTFGEEPYYSASEFFENGKLAKGGGFIGGTIAFAITSVIGNVGMIVLAIAVIALYITYFFPGDKNPLRNFFDSLLYAFVRCGAFVEKRFKKAAAEKKANSAIRAEEKRRAEERREAKRIEELKKKESELYEDDYVMSGTGLKELSIPQLGINTSLSDEDVERNPTLQEKVFPNGLVEEEPVKTYEPEPEVHGRKHIQTDYGFDPNEIEYTLENNGKDFVAEVTEVREPEEKKAATPFGYGLEDSAANVFTSDFNAFDFAANEKLASKQSSMAGAAKEQKTVTEEHINHSFSESDVDAARRRADFEMRKNMLKKQYEKEAAEKRASEEFVPTTVEFDINPEKAPEEVTKQSSAVIEDVTVRSVEEAEPRVLNRDYSAADVTDSAAASNTVIDEAAAYPAATDVSAEEAPAYDAPVNDALTHESPVHEDSNEEKYRRAAEYANVIRDMPRAVEAEKRAEDAEKRLREAVLRAEEAERRAEEAEKARLEEAAILRAAEIERARAAEEEKARIAEEAVLRAAEEEKARSAEDAILRAAELIRERAAQEHERDTIYASVEDKQEVPVVYENDTAEDTDAAYTIQESKDESITPYFDNEEDEDEGGDVFTGDIDTPVTAADELDDEEDDDAGFTYSTAEDDDGNEDNVFIFDGEIPPEEQNPEILELRKRFSFLNEEDKSPEKTHESAPAAAVYVESDEDEDEADRDDDRYAYTYAEREDDVELPAIKDSDEDEDEPPFDNAVAVTAPVPVAEAPKHEKPDYSNFEFPSLDILAKGRDEEDPRVAEEISEYGDKLIDALDQFDVRASIKSVDRGPRITRYEIVPARGVRVNKVIGLFDDIALNLAAEGIRMEAPIPGKSAIGVEIPNKHPSTVYLRDLLETDEFTNEKSKTFACVGKDVTGNPVFCDVAKMPHMLVAGATGMGKSVCINSILISILYKAKPDEVKFIMIDPKTVEFTMYNGIPHLLVPVVTDVKQAAGALMWAVDEMNRRYALLAKHEVRKLESYNELVKEHPEIGEPLPKIIIVIDELNDLMQQVKKPVEGLIMLITQKARAAGIHMIIGTQRPSVDVVTGVIKANIPSRIACKVAAFADSKTILDQSGAEKLLDKGDMLYAPVGKPKPIRVQGAFVSDGEVDKIMRHLKSTVNGNIYDEEALAEMTRAAQKCSKGKDGDDIEDESGGSEEGVGYLNDKQFLEAVDLAIKTGKISTSLIQRKISIGYGKAAKFIDIMEDMGIVSEPNGQKPRDVLVTRDEWHEMLARRSLDD